MKKKERKGGMIAKKVTSCDKYRFKNINNLGQPIIMPTTLDDPC